jgi:hypothetical protein
MSCLQAKAWSSRLFEPVLTTVCKERPCGSVTGACGNVCVASDVSDVAL